MRLFRGSIVSVLLVLLAACGVTGDKVDQATTTSASSSTESTTESSTSSTESSTTSTTEGGDDPVENDPELEALLLSAEDFGAGLEVDPDSDVSGVDDDICEGQSFTVAPIKQASVGYTTSGENTFATEAIAEFNFEDDASLFLSELQSLNEACKAAGDDDAFPGTFEPIEDLGDEAIRAIPDPGGGAERVELILVRADERVILLASFGEEQLLTNPVIIEAVDRAEP